MSIIHSSCLLPNLPDSLLHLSPSSSHPHSCSFSLSCQNVSKSALTWVHMPRQCATTRRLADSWTSTNISSPLRGSGETARRSSETCPRRCKQGFTNHRWALIGVSWYVRMSHVSKVVIVCVEAANARYTQRWRCIAWFGLALGWDGGETTEYKLQREAAWKAIDCAPSANY